MINTSMRSQRGAMDIVLIVIVALALGLGAWAGYSGMFQGGLYISPSPTPTESASPIGSPTTGWKTYLNAQYGFQISYPAAYRLESQLVLVPGSPTGELDFDSATKALNRSLPENSPDLFVGMIAYADTNLPKTRLQACTEGGGTLDSKGVCNGPASISQEDMRLESQAIQSAKAGDTVNGGTLVVLPSGVRGVRSLTFSPQTGNYDVSFVLFDQAKNRIEIYFTISASTEAAARADSRNALFDQIIATFKFTDAKVGWKMYTNTAFGVSFSYPASDVLREQTSIANCPDACLGVAIELTNKSQFYFGDSPYSDVGGTEGSVVVDGKSYRTVTQGDETTIFLSDRRRILIPSLGLDVAEAINILATVHLTK